MKKELKLFVIEANDGYYRGTTDYYEVYNVISTSYNEALNKIKSHTKYVKFELIEELYIEDGVFSYIQTCDNI